jgi:hypothetical protein
MQYKLNIMDQCPNCKGENVIAINKLIDINHGDNFGNINHKSIKVNWGDYQNNLLLIRNNNLTIIPISRIL